jgi:hypothetical protein
MQQPSPLTGSPRLRQLKGSLEDNSHHFVRSFSITKRGLLKTKVVGDSRSSLDSSKSEGHHEAVAEQTHKLSVLLLGASGVGKKALIREFMDPDAADSPFESLGK